MNNLIMVIRLLRYQTRGSKKNLHFCIRGGGGKKKVTPGVTLILLFNYTTNI